jgi:acyl-CoA thioesterase-1
VGATVGRPFFLFCTRALCVAALASIAVSCGDSPVAPPPPPTPDPLVVTCPAPVSQPSTTGQPLAVRYGTATATGGTPPVQITCTPGNDTLFAIGATRVTCTGVDTRGQSNSCSFTVTVTPPPTVSLTQYVAFGDSITAGEITVVGEGGFHTLQVIPSLSYPTDLRDSLQARYSSQQIVVVNEGVKGEITSMGVARLPGVLARGYQVLLLHEGANDINNATDAQVLSSLSNIRNMVRFAKGRGVRVFLGTMTPQRPYACNPCRAGGVSNIPGYNLGLQAIAASEGVGLVDVFAAFHGDVTTLIGPDGLHPTADGYRVMAGAFFDSIKTALEIPSTTIAPSSLHAPVVSIPWRKK